ncbi:hypothetical protein GCM10009785_20250 [Brooklawnia cerclae]|uniref:ESX-1 secretion-associated protein n=1 Tax=Brooklawnia cerclae TaxID=349934 RepID=A0ABX0SIV2_9ACTN|nr:hypothetical protein [Brooklawnia cerclae]NIH57233.1 hypothetical protein [Brooklawnia cerclae]
MGYEVSVSPEQLFSGADALQALAEDCVADQVTDSSPGSEDDSWADRPPDALDQARGRQLDALSGAVAQLGRTLQKASDTLRGSARDYQQTETAAVELIARTVGQTGERGFGGPDGSR